MKPLRGFGRCWRRDPPLKRLLSDEAPAGLMQDRWWASGARHHVGMEKVCVSRVADCGSCCPQYAQFAQEGLTGFSHFGHVCCSEVPQFEQNGNFDFSICPQPGHGVGRGSRRMKYKITPTA